MKRSIRWAWLVFLSGIVTAVLPPAWTANSAAPAAAVKAVSAAGYLENVVFERLPGRRWSFRSNPGWPSRSGRAMLC